MVKFICDRCNKIIGAGERNRCQISYGDNSADLCTECFNELLNWMKSKPIEICERVDWDGKVHTVLL